MVDDFNEVIFSSLFISGGFRPFLFVDFVGVSTGSINHKNEGPPKWLVYDGTTTFWKEDLGFPIYGNPHVRDYSPSMVHGL